MDAPVLESSCLPTSSRLREGERVEVRQRNHGHGPGGSWHPATLVTLKPGRRIVEYDELLSDDGARKRRESIPTPNCMQKSSSTSQVSFHLANSPFSSSTLLTSQKSRLLRPTPPVPADPHFSWKSGLFVDVFVKDAWREAVLLGDVEKNACVTVLYLGEGNSTLVPFKSLRVSQLWDEATGKWIIKGRCNLSKFLRRWGMARKEKKDTSWDDRPAVRYKQSKLKLHREEPLLLNVGSTVGNVAARAELDNGSSFGRCGDPRSDELSSLNESIHENRVKQDSHLPEADKIDLLSAGASSPQDLLEDMAWEHSPPHEDHVGFGTASNISACNDATKSEVDGLNCMSLMQCVDQFSEAGSMRKAGEIGLPSSNPSLDQNGFGQSTFPSCQSAIDSVHYCLSNTCQSDSLFDVRCLHKKVYDGKLCALDTKTECLGNAVYENKQTLSEGETRSGLDNDRELSSGHFVDSNSCHREDVGLVDLELLYCTSPVKNLVETRECLHSNSNSTHECSKSVISSDVTAKLVSDHIQSEDRKSTVIENDLRQKLPQTVSEAGARHVFETVGHRNGAQFCAEDSMLQGSSETTPCNTNDGENSHNLSSELVLLETAGADDTSSSQQPKKLLEDSGCFHKVVCEGPRDSSHFDSNGDKKCIDDQKFGSVSSTVQDQVLRIQGKFKLETIAPPVCQCGKEKLTCQEPFGVTCMKVASDFLTDNHFVGRHSSCKMELVDCEGSQSAQVNNTLDEATDNEENACKENLLNPGASEGEGCIEMDLKKGMIEPQFESPSGRGKTMGAVSGPRNVPETSKGLSGKKGGSFFSASCDKFEEETHGSPCEKHTSVQYAAGNPSVLCELRPSMLLPSLPICVPQNESLAATCKAEPTNFSMATKTSSDCGRGSDGHPDASEKVDMSFNPQDTNMSTTLGRVAMARVQGQPESLLEADDQSSQIRKSNHSHRGSSIKFISSGTRSQQNEEPCSMDFLEERPARCFEKRSIGGKSGRNLRPDCKDFEEKRPAHLLNKYYSGRLKRQEKNVELKRLGGGSDCRNSGFQAEASTSDPWMKRKPLTRPRISSGDRETASRKTQEMKAPVPPMKRKVSDEPQERFSRPGLRKKSGKFASLFEADVYKRSDNDTLLSFRDHLVLQRQADSSRRKVKYARKGSEPKEEIETKTRTESIPAEKPNNQVVMPGNQNIVEQKVMSSLTTPMLQEKSLKVLTRDVAKQALLDAGFKIDLRPRRSRDYRDSVYVSPDGQAFWSIPKAWEALKKLQAHKAINNDKTGSSNYSSQECGTYEKSAISSAKGQTNKQSFDNNSRSALKEVFTRFGNNEWLQTALSTRGICFGSSLEMVENCTWQAQNGTRQANMTNADLTDILLGELGLLRRVTKKSSSQKRSKDNKCAAVSFRMGKMDSANGKRRLKQKQNNKQISNMLDREHLAGRGHSKKLQVVCSSKEREQKRQWAKETLKETMLETKSTFVKSKAMKGETFLKKVDKIREKPKQRSGLRLEVRQSNLIGSEDLTSQSSRTVFAWMIDRGVVLERQKIFVRKNENQVRKEGAVTREGILCSCCNIVFTAHSFQAHAGSDCVDCDQDLILTSGKCFLDHQLKAWDAEIHLRRVHNYIGISDDDTNDDSCLICGDGGDLICCDSCPSTFHASCLEINNVPDGNWYCPKCCCAVCSNRQHDEENGDPMIVCCNQCEQRYHLGCLGGCPSLTDREVFCQPSCEQIFSSLQHLVGIPHSLHGGFSWSLLRCSKEEKMESIHNIMQIDCHSKLAVALLVIKECFNPMVDPRTNIDMLTHAVYNRWSEFDRLNYTGFYTVILEKEGEIISVATIRIHGARLAEMPLIGTREKYRRQGMCRLLVGLIEKLLSSLQVASFILPAIPELFETWTHAFGFKRLHSSLKSSLKDASLMVFPGTELLHKSISGSPLKSP